MVKSLSRIDHVVAGAADAGGNEKSCNRESRTLVRDLSGLILKWRHGDEASSLVFGFASVRRKCDSFRAGAFARAWRAIGGRDPAADNEHGPRRAELSVAQAGD